MTEINEKPKSLEPFDFPKGMGIYRPAGVDFFESKVGKPGLLPREITQEQTFLEQVEKRQQLFAFLDEVFKDIPDTQMEFKTAVEQGLITQDTLIRLYSELADFLLEDLNNFRLILYLPFQLLPNLKDTQPEPKLAQAERKFHNSYMLGFKYLTSESDVRALFVDGDIVEEELSGHEPTRVRKVAHLVPQLIGKDFVTVEEIIRMIEETSDTELTTSLIEMIPVLFDMGVVTPEQLQKMKKSLSDPLFTFASSFVPTHKITESSQQPVEKQSFSQLRAKLITELGELDDRYASNSPYVEKMTKERIAWEKPYARTQVIENYAKKAAIDELTMNDVLSSLETELQDNTTILLGIKSALFALEEYTTRTPDKAEALIQKVQEVFEKFWQTDSSEIKDSLISFWSHAIKLHLLPPSYTDQFGIDIPDLSKPFPAEIEKLADTEFRSFFEASKSIEEDPLLSEYLYSVFLAFGSRIKGYARTNSDTDFAVFFKPETPWEKRDEVLERLKQVTTGILPEAKVLEFWTDERDGKLTLQNIAGKTATVVGAQQIHFLLGGIWLGKSRDIKHIYEDIIPRYLNLDRLGDQKEFIRTQLLRQIELDILQVRLMHKGYRLFYPNKKEIGSPHAQAIDWDSDFWDPGYRRIATQLFVSRVFLPDLSSTTEVQDSTLRS